jgi:hypothetical protein
VSENKVSAGDEVYPNIFAMPAAMSFDTETLDVNRDYQAEHQQKNHDAGNINAGKRNADAWNKLLGVSDLEYRGRMMLLPNDHTPACIACIPVGSNVTIGGSIRANVLQICIQSHNRVTYEVAWWAGNTRSTAWVDAGEIEKHVGACVRIGF